MKISGRDAGKICAVIDIVNDNIVIIDGAVRRRKCNIKHLEFLGHEVKIKKNADTDEVISSLNTLGFKIKEAKKGKKSETKKEKPKPTRKTSKKDEIKQTKLKKK